MKKVLIVLVTLFIALFAPRVGSLVANLFDVSALDPDGAFLWLYIHHMVQALIVLGVIYVVSKKTSLRFGFSLGDKEKGIMFIKKFSFYFFIYTVVVMGIMVLSADRVTMPFPLNLRNSVGYLSFQLLMSGPSEEIIFRSFIMTILGAFISHKILKGHLSLTNVIAAFVFMVAHIGFQFSPFSMSYEPMQLLYSFVLGVIYGICFEKTRSVYYPMVLHSISNVISVSLVMLVQILV